MRNALRPYATTGAAMATAGAIALSLVGPPPALSETRVPAVYSSTADVELTASAGTFVNPIERWVEVLEATNTSLSTLADKTKTDPMPVLRQIIANQSAYASIIGTSLTTTATGLVQWLTSEQGTGIGSTLPASLPVIMERLSQGDIIGAQSEFASALSGLATTLFTMLDLLALPYQVSANVTAALKTIVREGMFNTGLVGKTGFGLLATVQMAAQQLAESAQAIVDAGEAGDPVAALSAIINAPADLADVVINGHVNRFGKRVGGLLTFTAAGSSGWSLGSALLVHIPQAIAAAITPPAPAPAIADVASLPSPTAKTLSLNVGSTSESAEVPSVGTATETTTTDQPAEAGSAEAAPTVDGHAADNNERVGTATPLVRKSRIAIPGKAETSAADNDRANPIKNIRAGISSTVKKVRNDANKASEGLGKKRSTSVGSKTSESGGSHSDK